MRIACRRWSNAIWGSSIPLGHARGVPRSGPARAQSSGGNSFGVISLRMGGHEVQGKLKDFANRGGGPIALRPPRCVQLGRTTVSMTWMTPLLAATSVLTTLALSTVTAPSVTLTSSDWPFTVLAFIVLTSAAMTLPATTW